MPTKDRVSPANLIIAEFLDVDINEVTEMIYQPTIYRAPRVYSWDDNPWSYFCCPRPGQKVYGVRYENLKKD
jgi:hypothetical protein